MGSENVYVFFELLVLLVFLVVEEFVLFLELLVRLGHKLFFFCDGFKLFLEFAYDGLFLLEIVLQLFLAGSVCYVVYQLIKVVHQTVLL